ncbi:MAG: hypothetical protein JW888_18315 [Pirellulales bacterium]|nr:hypothetical protein [Pirellulales bacterium]
MSENPQRMKHESSPEQRTFEAIELAGRARVEASDPASRQFAALLAARPELAQLCERSARLDETLGCVFRDVPVPEGLLQRILSRLEEAQTEDPDGPVLAAPGRSASSSRNTDVLPGKRLSRRWWIAGTTGVVAASVLIAGMLCLWTSNGPTSAQEVLHEAMNRFVATDAAPGELISAETLASNPLLASHPFSDDIRRLPRTRWRKVEDFLGGSAVAYEMTGWGGTRATLFVLPCRHQIDGLRAKPAHHSNLATGGKAAGAWQTDGLLYVLVVEGDERAYRRFLDPGRPLT